MYSCKKAILKYFAEFTAYINGQDVYVMFSNGGHRLVDSVDDFSEDVKYIILKDSYFIYRKALAEGKTIQVFVDYTTKYNDRTWIDADTIHAYIPVKNYRIKPNEPTFPCYYKEKSSGIIVYFKGDDNPNCYNLPGQYLGTVIKGNCGLQSSTGFKWRCWDTFINPDRWEHLKNYIEEPKFKVGDWVRLNDEIAKVSAVVDGIIDNLELNGKFYLPLRKDTLELWEPQPNEWCIFTSSEDPTDIALGKFTGMSGNLYVSSAVRGSSWTYCEPFIGTLPTGCTK